MTKTLADMTADERQSCVGMWADAMHCTLRGIILGVFYDHARVLIPENTGEYSDEEEYIWVLKNVVPRLDLPRAWNPDGTPLKGKWENTRTPDNPHDPLLRRRFISEYEDRTND